jgi:hypothetical protein
VLHLRQKDHERLLSILFTQPLLAQQLVSPHVYHSAHQAISIISELELASRPRGAPTESSSPTNPSARPAISKPQMSIIIYARD